jgi:hypothetical protein
MIPRFTAIPAYRYKLLQKPRPRCGIIVLDEIYFQVKVVKQLLSCLLLSAAALAQSPSASKVVTFNPADKEHCKVVAFNGKPMLETTYNGTTVAITMPQNWGNGEFSVMVAVAQTGAGNAEVNPKEVSALYPDPDHTRFRWFDKARDLDAEASRRAAGVGQPGGAPGGGPGGPPGGSPGALTDASAAMGQTNHPEQMHDTNPQAATKAAEEARQLQLRGGAGNAPPVPQLDPAHPPTFLRPASVKQGSSAIGYVFLRKPKGSKLEVTPSGIFDEIDIPVNGVTFRF